jgi:hypothetical protein
MIIEHLSTNTLLSMHVDIQACLNQDDKNPSQEKKYGARIHSDWKETSERIESELTKRNMVFHPIQWIKHK